MKVKEELSEEQTKGVYTITDQKSAICQNVNTSMECIPHIPHNI